LFDHVYVLKFSYLQVENGVLLLFLFLKSGISLIYIYACLQHANGENPMVGIDGNTGEITDMKELGVRHLRPCPSLVYSKIACVRCWDVLVV